MLKDKDTTFYLKFPKDCWGTPLFNEKCVCIPFHLEFRLDLFITAVETDQNFPSVDNIGKFVYLMYNHQKAVINFLTKAIYKRIHSLYIQNSNPWGFSDRSNSVQNYSSPNIYLIRFKCIKLCNYWWMTSVWCNFTLVIICVHMFKTVE